MTNFELATATGATALAGILMIIQARLGSAGGSDSSSHLFLIRQLRKEKRLFTRIPDLLNRPHCGAVPLYLHALLAKMPKGYLALSAYLLNPVASFMTLALTLAIGMAIVGRTAVDSAWVASVVALTALCPQAFHALSARTFGFSSRGIGIFLFTAFFGGLLWLELNTEHQWWALAVMTIAAYLILGFNTFALQAMLLVSIVLSALTLSLVHWLAIMAGTAIFVAAHPTYSLSYLRYTWRFVLAYRRDLAPIFILARRHSIWRDLIWDIPRKLLVSPRAGIRYAYENSLVILLLTNPIAIAAIIARFEPQISSNAPIGLAASIALAGILVAFATSFRATRFLGEPERYVEIVTPWAVVAGSAWLWYASSPSITLLIAYCALTCVAQVAASSLLARYLASKPTAIDDAVRAIERDAKGRSIRLASNNEQLTKLFMSNEWSFSYLIAVGEDYCGLSVQEAFRQMPFLKSQALEHICRELRINYVVLDRCEYDKIFDDPNLGVVRERDVFVNEGLRVLHLDWSRLETQTNLLG